MPNRDKTGPLGNGTPGRGQGGCKRTPNPNFKKECGTGKGLRRNCNKEIGCRKISNRPRCCEITDNNK